MVDVLKNFTVASEIYDLQTPLFKLVRVVFKHFINQSILGK